MNRKLPVDAFDFYFSLGPTRSYKAVADKYGVNKRSVTALATREQWQTRIVDLERRAREKSDSKMVESIEAMQARHLKTLGAVYAKALETLRKLPIDTGMQAVKAIEMVIRQERVIRGEPTDRNALDIEQIIKREYALLMVGEEGGSDGNEKTAQ